MQKIIIAAVTKNNVLGKDGKIPWHSEEELKHFKRTTFGFPVIMGRKTWEAIGTPLPGRLNIVVTGNPDYVIPFHEVIIFNSLKSAVDFCSSAKREKVFFIGGAKIYEQAIESADKIILSVMNFETEGDVFFVKVDESKWLLNSTENHTDFAVHHYIRKPDLKLIG